MTASRPKNRDDIAATSSSLFREVGASASLLSGFAEADRAAFAPKEREEIGALSWRLERLAAVVGVGPKRAR